MIMAIKNAILATAEANELVEEVKDVLGTQVAEPDVIRRFLEELPEKLLALGVRILLALLVFAIGTQVIKVIRKIIRRSMSRANADTGAIQFVDSFVKAALNIILVFMIATSFGIDAASIIALVGSAGVAIGLAVQGSLSNLAGGVLLLLLKPFKVGDYIVAESGHEGTVNEIQIFYTKLVTPDNKVIVLPNGILSNNSIVNATAAKIRRMDIVVGISYSSDIRLAKEVLMNVIKNDEAVLKDKDMNVFVDQLAESSVNLGVRCWFNNEDFWAGKWRVTEKCKYALDDAGIVIPFPQLDVHLKQHENMAVSMHNIAEIKER